jgi:hypothetical protein
VPDGNALEREIKRLLEDEPARTTIGKAGQERLLASRGALERYVKMIDRLLT